MDEFEKLLKDSADRLGKEVNLDGLREYVSERVLHLSNIVGDDFQLALRAERDNVALKAGLRLVNAADRADRELLGIISGALAVLV